MTSAHFWAFLFFLWSVRALIKKLDTDQRKYALRRLQNLICADPAVISVPQLVQSLHTLSHHILFYNLSSPEQILSIFPETFHSSLKNLITKILLENRVDLVTGSDKVSRMSMPTCLVQLKLEDPCQSTNMESDSTMTVELSKESLDTMLDGLGRIRDQLSVVAGK
uniref:COMM domain containing 9 n=1 Tax=Oryzias sinensis TaxID=183150 RepID=A0A8C7YYL0_9TELE